MQRAMLRHRGWVVGGALLGAAVVVAGIARLGPRWWASSRLQISGDTRLLVVAPHPGDELLAAGGLMQRVMSARGGLFVVYLTDGDGYPVGVQARKGVAIPTANDFRDYGKRRQQEARQALGALRLGSYSFRFLGFPDGGLCRLTTTYWSERAAAYRSPFTRLDRPPRSEIVVPNTEYRGEDLTQELATLIDAFRPTIVLVPRQEDQHPDHCAAWLFVADALADVARVRAGFRTDLLTYVIHFDDWPFETASPRLVPPPDLGAGASGWIDFSLTDRELALKRDALKEYRTQIQVMRWFLDGFARTNEIFSHSDAPHVVLPARRNPCCG